MPVLSVNNRMVNYVLFVKGLIKKHKTSQEDYMHGPVGVCKEAGELLDNAYRHWNYNKPQTPETRANIIEEAGDILFYLQATLTLVGSSIEEAIEGNIVKLWERYPDGYSDEAALARIDKPAGE